MVKVGTHKSKRVPKSFISFFYNKGYCAHSIWNAARNQGYRISYSTIKNRVADMKCSGILPQQKVRVYSHKLKHLRPSYLRIGMMKNNLQTTSELHPFVTEEAREDVCLKTTYNFLKRQKELSRGAMGEEPERKASEEKQRLVWARNIEKLKLRAEKLHFLDETYFTFQGPKRHCKVWWPKHRKRPTKKIKRPHRQGVIGYVGCIGYNEVPDLVRIEKLEKEAYCQMLQQLLPHGACFFHDRCSVHTSKYTRKFCQEHGYEVYELPAKACDLNPIENVFGRLKSLVYPHNVTYRSKQTLDEAVQAGWKVIQEDRQYREHLIKSFAHRLEKVILAKGGHAGY